MNNDETFQIHYCKNKVIHIHNRSNPSKILQPFCIAEVILTFL